MKRIAAPMVGGLVTSAFLTLEIIPVIYTYWRNEQLFARRLSEAGVGYLDALQGARRLGIVGASVTVGTLLARLYVAHPAPMFGRASIAGCVVCVAALVAFIVVRSRARRALEAAEASGRARCAGQKEGEQT